MTIVKIIYLLVCNSQQNQSKIFEKLIKSLHFLKIFEKKSEMTVQLPEFNQEYKITKISSLAI